MGGRIKDYCYYIGFKFRCCFLNSSNRQIGQYGVQSDDSSLYYMRARYYNAAIKRFINQDTVTGSIESSQSLNRYAYVEGNPISYLDPFGLEKTLSIGQQFVIDILSLLIQNATRGGTIMRSISLDGSFGADGGIGISMTLDSLGNFAMTYDNRYGVGMFSLGISIGKTYLDAPDMTSIGITVQMGGSMDVGFSIGADYIKGENTNSGNADYEGYAISTGIGIAGAAAEGHITIGESYNIFRVNIIEWTKKQMLKY